MLFKNLHSGKIYRAYVLDTTARRVGGYEIFPSESGNNFQAFSLNDVITDITEVQVKAEKIPAFWVIKK